MKNKKAFTLAETQTCHCEDERSEDVTIQTQNSDYQINNTGLSRSQRSLTVTRGFTLAETMIVLVILGVIASITIPAVVRNQIEAQNRTKLKKCMTVYDTAINKMVVENGLKSNNALTNWGNNNNCVNTKQYFKVAQDDENGNGCVFKSADGVWWNIEDITRPKIDLKNGDFNDENSLFQLFGHLDKNGSLRVSDLQHDKANLNDDNYITQADIDNLTALYDFVNNNKKSSDKDEKKSPFDVCKEKGQDTCVVNGAEYNKVTWDAKEEQCSNQWIGAVGGYETEVCITPASGSHYVFKLSTDEIDNFDGTIKSADTMCKQKGGRLPTREEALADANGYYWIYDSKYGYDLCYWGNCDYYGYKLDDSVDGNVYHIFCVGE